MSALEAFTLFSYSFIQCQYFLYMTFIEDWISKAVTLNHVGCVQFPCRCQSLRNDVVDDDTFPAFSATFAYLSSHLHHAYALLPVSTPVIRFCFCPSLWASLQFTGRAHGQQTNAGPSPPLTERKQSSRAESRLLRNFSAWSLHNAYSPHLSGSSISEKRLCVCMKQTMGEALDTKHTLGLTKAVCDLGLLISQKICKTQRN